MSASQEDALSVLPPGVAAHNGVPVAVRSPGIVTEFIIFIHEGRRKGVCFHSSYPKTLFMKTVGSCQV